MPTIDPGKILSFLSLAYKDYLASRVLFNKELLLEACILANTSIEKYFKAIIAFQGKSAWGHDISKLLNALKNFDPKLYEIINKEFIEFLCKAYKLRYFDDLPEGYNLAISQYKILAELDYTVSILSKKLKFKKNDKDVELSYDLDLRNNNQNLWENNYILNKTNKSKFIEREQAVYEVRILKLTNVLEVVYRSRSSKNDGLFLKEALKPG